MQKRAGRPATGQTPHTTFRIPAHLRDEARAIAERRKETLTDVIVRALRSYVARHRDE